MYKAVTAFLVMWFGCSASLVSQEHRLLVGLESYVELAPANIRTNFILNKWGMKRISYQKKGGRENCVSEVFIYGRDKFSWDDEVFCSGIKETYKAKLDVDVVLVLVYKIDRSMYVKENIRIPDESFVVMGYRDRNQFTSVAPFKEKAVNLVISEIYSANLGHVIWLFGRSLY